MKQEKRKTIAILSVFISTVLSLLLLLVVFPMLGSIAMADTDTEISTDTTWTLNPFYYGSVKLVNNAVLTLKIPEPVNSQAITLNSITGEGSIHIRASEGCTDKNIIEIGNNPNNGGGADAVKISGDLTIDAYPHIINIQGEHNKEVNDYKGGNGVVCSHTTVSSGIVNVTGGDGSNLYNNGSGGTGIIGDITLTGGELYVSGGVGYSNNRGGYGINGNVTLAGGRIDVSGGNSENSSNAGDAYAPGSKVTVAEGFYYTNGEDIYTDETTISDGAELNAYCKKLYPCPVEIISNGEKTGGASLVSALSNAQDGDTVRLLENIEMYDDDYIVISDGKTVTLDLNNHIIRYKDINYNDNKAMITCNGNLIVTDNSDNQTEREYEGFASFKVRGGVINGNYAARKGWGVIVKNDGTLTMKDGAIINNFDGGVKVESGGNFKVEGDVQITGNGPASAGTTVSNNVCLAGSAAESAMITVTGALAETADIGVTMESGTGVFAKAVSGYNKGRLTDSDIERFMSDNNDYSVILDSEGKARIGKRYAVTVVNGSKSGSYSEGSVVTITADAPETGMVFDKWKSQDVTFIDGSDTLPTAKFIMPGKEATVTAHYKDASYTVRFDGNGATSGEMEDQGFTYNKEQSLTANAYGRSCTVTYNYDGATGGNDKTDDKAAAVFDGWAESKDGASKYSNRQSVKNLTSTDGETVTLYARWTDGSVTLPAPEKKGFVFGGWFGDSGFKSKAGDAGESYTPSADCTLYAKWTAEGSAENSYTVHFDGNGATSGEMEDQGFTYNKEQSLTANAYSRSYTVTYNYDGATSGNDKADDTAASVFDGWAESKDGAIKYSDRQSVKNLTSTDGDTVTLYARWTDGSVTLPAPEKEGFVFGGWFGDSGFKTKAGDTGESFTPSADCTLYAKWTAEGSAEKEVEKAATPELIKATSNSIQVKAAEGTEYSIDDGKNWRTDGIFTGLEAGKKYSIYARIAANGEIAAGEASDPLEVSTLEIKKEVVSNKKLDGFAGEIETVVTSEDTGDEGYSFKDVEIPDEVALSLLNNLSKEDQDRVRNGEKFTITFAATETIIETEETKNDKAKADKVIKEKTGGTAGAGVMLDIKLFTQVGSSNKKEAEPVSGSGKVSFTVQIPVDMVNTDNSVIRTYYLIHIFDNGEVEIVGSGTGSEIPAETESFSSWYLTYVDEKKDENKDGKKDENKDGKKDENKDESGSNPPSVRVITVSDNLPMDYRTEEKNGIRVSYSHEIPFFGKGKGDISLFGEKGILVEVNEKNYKANKIKINKKVQSQILCDG